MNCLGLSGFRQEVNDSLFTDRARAVYPVKVVKNVHHQGSLRLTKPFTTYRKKIDNCMCWKWRLTPTTNQTIPLYTNPSRHTCWSCTLQKKKLRDNNKSYELKKMVKRKTAKRESRVMKLIYAYNLKLELNTVLLYCLVNISGSTSGICQQPHLKNKTNKN